MIELFKEDGTLKHRVKILYDFTEMKVAEAKEAWLEEQRVAYALAYPAFEMVIDEDGVEARFELEQVVSFDEYLVETVVVQAAAEATDTTEAVEEIVAFVREFVAPEVTEAMLDMYLDTREDLRKAIKVKTLDELTITANTVAFDADGKAIGNMGAVLAVANFKYIQALSIGTTPDIAYKSIFKDTEIGWKGADNAVHVVQIETVAEALEKSMHAVAEVLGV